MRQIKLSIRLLGVICLSALGSCAQNNQIQERGSTQFVGSTPCDSFIRVQLGIPIDSKCDFIKWELNLDPAGSDSFKITAVYGESRPNTNGFMKDAHYGAKGIYIFAKGDTENPRYRVLHLNAPQLKSPLLFIAMDSNILHFADHDNRLLVGNGGWGYVLNRMNKR
jgi:hypothetical protein